MVLSVDVPRQVMDEDSSSDWDSLTEPAPKAQKPPNVELDSDEDRSHSHRSKKSNSPTVVPPQQPRKQESPVWTPRRDKGRGAPKPTPSMDVDFRPALTTSSPDPSPVRKAPGKDRKGNTYDAPRNTYEPPKSSSPPSHISLTVDDSDDDAALAALRRTYEQNKPRNSRDYSAKDKESGASSQQKSGSGTKSSASHSKAAGDARPSQSVVSMAASDSPGPPLPSNAPRGYHGHHHQESLMVGGDEGYHPGNSRRGDEGYHPGNSRRGDEGYHPGNSRHTHRSDGSARSARSGDDLLVVESSRGRKAESQEEEDEEKRLQVYYFDEAHTDYYLSKQEGPVAVMEGYADKAELIINRGWREFFSVLRIGTLLITVFVTELIKFVIGSILRPMYVGLIVILGDRLLKPFFAATFNGVLQPFLILAYNTFIGVRMAVGPLLDVIQRMTSMGAELLLSLRLVTVQNTHYHNNGGKADHESSDDGGKLTVMKESSVV